jgi:hypothetical protein
MTGLGGGLPLRARRRHDLGVEILIDGATEPGERLLATVFFSVACRTLSLLNVIMTGGHQKIARQAEEKPDEATQ